MPDNLNQPDRPDQPKVELSAALAAIWQRSQPQMLERLALLERVAATEPMPETLRQEAAAIAHKLAGTLGMFGFAQGTELARELEQHLELPQTNHATLASLTDRLREAVFPCSPPDTTT